LISNESR